MFLLSFLFYSLFSFNVQAQWIAGEGCKVGEENSFLKEINELEQSLEQQVKPEFLVMTPTIKEGIIFFYQWANEETKKNAFQNSTIKKSIESQDIFLNEENLNKKILVQYNQGNLKYFFFTALKEVKNKAFVIQRIKKVVETFEEGNPEPISTRTTYLVEVFKTWKGAFSEDSEMNNQMKKADLHSGDFYLTREGYTKVVTKYFETGLGTINEIFPDENKWSHESSKLYWGTEYLEDNDYFNKVNFIEKNDWVLETKITNKGFTLKSEELGLDEKGGSL